MKQLFNALLHLWNYLTSKTYRAKLEKAKIWREKMSQLEKQANNQKKAKEYQRLKKERDIIEMLKPRPSNNQKKRCSRGLHQYATTSNKVYTEGTCVYCKAKKTKVKKVA